MENYQLYKDSTTKNISPYAKRLSDNAFIHTELNQQYLLWLEEGNKPLPPDPIPEPEPLTAQQKLEAAGLTVEELKELLGL